MSPTRIDDEPAQRSRVLRRRVSTPPRRSAVSEDPDRNFAPCPGLITDYHAPGGHGVRLDTHVYSGYSIPPYYDSMISKLIVVAQTRDEAILKMQRALDEYVIEGVKTTIPFHQRLMRHERFKSGNFTTKFMEEETV